MPRKKQQPAGMAAPKMQGFIAGAGEIVRQDISETLRKNYALRHERDPLPGHPGDRRL